MPHQLFRKQLVLALEAAESDAAAAAGGAGAWYQQQQQEQQQGFDLGQDLVAGLEAGQQPGGLGLELVGSPGAYAGGGLVEEMGDEEGFDESAQMVDSYR
jgi:hypothetical protein